jgi:mRNA interferase MazF
MEFLQRDIILAHFPFTDLSQTKLRPALIISSKEVNQSFDFVCVQITSRPLTDPLYFKLNEEMIEGSLLLVSGIRLHKIFCLNKKLVLHKIAALSPKTFDLVIEQITSKVLAR